MKSDLTKFLAEHRSVTRRYFLRCGTVGVAAMGRLPMFARAGEREPALREALDNLETWLTKQDDFRDVSRGKPIPHSLDEARRKEVGLTRATWSLEVVDDPENTARLRTPLTQAENTAFTFDDLMKLAAEHAVRIPKVMTCLNLGCPLGNGIWEGVPLRKVLWLTQPSHALRRVYYYGYHNDEELPKDDQYFTKAPWRDAEILPPPKQWGGGILDNRIPTPAYGFDPRTGQPKTWPMRLSKVHWAVLLPGLPAAAYTLRCRTIDDNGIAQPMPRPFRKSGRAEIGQVKLTVQA